MKRTQRRSTKKRSKPKTQKKEACASFLLEIDTLFSRQTFDRFRDHLRVKADALNRAGFVRHVRLRRLAFRLYAEGNRVVKRAGIGAAADGEGLCLLAGGLAVDVQQRIDEFAVGVDVVPFGDFFVEEILVFCFAAQRSAWACRSSLG